MNQKNVEYVPIGYFVLKYLPSSNLRTSNPLRSYTYSPPENCSLPYPYNDHNIVIDLMFSFFFNCAITS